MNNKVFIMLPIQAEINNAAKMLESARLADDTDSYEDWSKQHHNLVVARDLGLNYIEIPTGVDNNGL